MPDFIECNYQENLIERLERISDDFFSEDFQEINNDLLIENTRTLNEELSNFRKLSSTLLTAEKITPSLKRRFGEKFVSSNIAREYQRKNIEKAQDLIEFINSNQDFFRESFPTNDRILDALSELDPVAFRPFSSEFPNIDIRLRSSPISSAEVNSIIRENGFDPNLFSRQVKENRRNIFNLLERFLSRLGIGVGIMGSFCALVEDVFALVRNKKDISDNPAFFIQNFTNVLGLINPSAAAVVGQVQQLISLVQSARQNSMDITDNLKQAFSTLASAFGIAINFFDVSTGQSGNIEVNWNFTLIRDAITANDPLFLVIVPSTNKPLGDINQDGVVNSDDATALQTYIDGSPSQETFNYVENILKPFLNDNAKEYSQFADFPSSQNPDSSLGDILNTFSSVSKKFGAPGSGDFGLQKISEILSIANSIISSIRNLISGTKPVNIRGLFQQLDRVLQLGIQGTDGIFKDFRELSSEYNLSVQNALKEAEENSVTNPAKTAKIDEENKTAREENYTKALETTAEASKNLGSNLSRSVNSIKNGIRELAAVGVLEKIFDQLSSVIDQSSSDLKSRISFYTPESFGEGKFNMQSSYAKFAGLVASAKNIASEETTETVKNSVKGLIGQSAEIYRQKTKEEVEFVALRFCKLAGEIERLYREVTKPIETMIQTFQGVNRLLSGAGSDITRTAILSGAIRYDLEARRAAALEAIDATIAAPFINAAGQRSIDPGEGINPIGVLPPLPTDYEFPTIEELLMPGNPLASILRISARGPSRNVGYRPGPASRESGVWGFTARGPGSGSNGVDPEAFRRLFNLAKNWRKPVIVTSAFRTAKANASIRGASPNSNHLRGTAFDCSTDGYSLQDKLDFCNLAYNVGLPGIITYRTFIHISTSTGEGGSIGGPFSYRDDGVLTGPLGNRSFR